MKSRPSEWFAKTRRLSADFFVEDIKVRDFLEKKLARSGVAKVVIRKTLKEGEIILFASKVGVIMGKNGEKIIQNCNELCGAHWDVGAYYDCIGTRIKYYDYKE